MKRQSLRRAGILFLLCSSMSACTSVYLLTSTTGLIWHRHLGKAEQAIQRGDLERGRKHLDSALARARFLATNKSRKHELLIAVTIEGLATLAEAEGDYEGAVSHLRTALSMRERIYGPDSPSLFACVALAWNLVRSGDPPAGRDVHDRLIALPQREPYPAVLEMYNGSITIPLVGPTPKTVASSWMEMGVALNEAGREQESLRYFETSLEIKGWGGDARGSHVATTLMYYADVLDSLGRESEATLAREGAERFLKETHYGQYQTEFYELRQELVDWFRSESPLTVFIAPPPFEERERARQFESNAVAAVETWKGVLARETGRELRIVERDTSAVIKIGWSPFDPKVWRQLGFTRSTLSEDQQTVIAMEIFVHYRDAGDGPLDQLELYRVLLHEVGHAMGIMVHSPHPGDLMYPYLDGSWNEGTITDRDALTLRTLSAGRVVEDKKPELTWEPQAERRYVRTLGDGWERVVGDRRRAGPRDDEIWYSFDEMQAAKDAAADPQQGEQIENGG